jgi:hypothetical protein
MKLERFIVSPCLILITILCVGLFCSNASNSAMGADGEINIFECSLSPSAVLDLSSARQITTARVDVEKMRTSKEGRKVSLKFGSSTISGELTRVLTGAHDHLWNGSVSDAGEFTFIESDGVVTGRVELKGGKRFFVDSRGSGFTIEQIPHGPSKECAPTTYPARRPNVNARPSSPPRSAAHRTVEIDVGIFWTKAARLGANGGTEDGSEEAMKKHLRWCELTAREAFWIATADSRSPARAKLNFHSGGEVAYEESGIAGTDLERLTDLNGDHFKDVRAKRDHERYDIEMLIVENLDCGGKAWTMSEALKNDFSQYGFGVVERNSARLNYTLAHEIAHIFGCGHNVTDDASLPGLYRYSAGWHFTYGDTDYHTIMSYRKNDAERPYPLFSSPNKTLSSGGVTPTIVQLGKADVADNERTIQSTAELVSKFR